MIFFKRRRCALRYNSEKNELEISVTEFVEIARRGISSHAPHDEDEPSLRSSEALRRYITEGALPKKLTYVTDRIGSKLNIKGCADGVLGNELVTVRGFDSGRRKPTKEEISQARAEAFILGFMLSKESSLSSVLLTIIYINSKTGERITTKEEVNMKKLHLFFEKCAVLAERFAEPEIKRVTERLPSMKNARFPYGKLREGQHEFISTVYKNLTRGGTLFAQAPTGTGKTVSVVYPAVRALGDGRCDKVFYLTPKTTTAKAAKECIEAMSAHGVKIMAVMLGAKERVCKRGVLCKENKRLCPTESENKIIEAALSLYAKGITVVTETELSKCADQFCVCPHELSLTYSELCDFVICDINYLFDPRVAIKRYFSHGGHYSFLIDEAHNLPDRAREMYSAEFSASDLTMPLCSELIGERSLLRERAIIAAENLSALLFPYVKDEIRKDKDGVSHGFAHISEPPTELYEIFAQLSSLAESELFSARRAKDEERDERIRIIKDYMSKIDTVNTVLDMFSDGYEMFISYENSEISFKLFCIDPAKPIAKRLEKGHSAVFFSATLAPISYYRSVLGDDRCSSVLEIDSPFDSSQLCVSVMDKISTRISERDGTLSAVCRAIAACVSARRGHYMVFSPSFAYSEALMRAFSAKYPKIKVLLQTKDMTQAQKREFIAEFEKNEGTYLVAFCVTGGIYSEGIDLVGESLIGAVIVGISMPSLSCEREAIAAYYDEKCDEGKQYAYIYPGMNKVFQAAGRVIRRERDKGVVVLIDDRFADPIYKKSIPNLWRDLEFCSDAKDLRTRLDEFWKKVDEDTKNTLIQ